MNINTANITEGQIFPNFTQLFLAITGEKPPTGKRNKDYAERQLSQYIKYVKMSEIDPNYKSKRAIIIKEIYIEPKMLPENRGRQGTYANYLKPLLLNKQFFHGKLYRLYNELGVFSEFYQHQLNKSGNYGSNGKVLEKEFNPWKTSDNMYPGYKKYIRSLYNQMRTTMRRVLDSLEKEGLIKWCEYYQLVPSVVRNIPDSYYKRSIVRGEVGARNAERQSFLDAIMEDPNVVLRPELLCTLNIHDKSWDNEISCKEYMDFARINNWHLPPIRASKKQEAAIQNFELFVRQYAYKECESLDSFPALEDIPNEFEFFQVEKWVTFYKQHIKEYSPWLLGCDSIWKELEYEVTGSPEQIDRYLDMESFDAEEASRQLSCAFVSYMEKHLDSINFFSPIGTFQDLRCLLRNKPRSGEWPLKKSKSACKLHEQLKRQFNMFDCA